MALLLSITAMKLYDTLSAELLRQGGDVILDALMVFRPDDDLLIGGCW
jgi:hypothetical protein